MKRGDDRGSRPDDIWDVFLEDMERDLEQMDDGDCWVKCMRERFGRIKSLPETAALRQRETLATLTQVIDTVYAMSREEEVNQKQM